MLTVLQETQHWLAVLKPAGMSVEQGPGHYATVEQVVREYLSRKSSPAYLGITHRLDRPTSGIVLLAKKKAALRAFNEQFASGRTQKHYLAAVDRAPSGQAATLTHWLKKDTSARKAVLCKPTETGAREAKLWYRCLSCDSAPPLLHIRLFSGRYHQIRAQLGALECPVLNDVLYGAEQRFDEPCIGLHAWRLEFTDPHTGKTVHLRAPVPKAPCWPERWQGKSRPEELLDN